MSKSKLLLLGLGLAAGSMFFSVHPAAAAYTPKAGDLLKTPTGHTVYLVDDSLQRIPVTAEAYKIRYKNNFTLVKIVEAQDIASFATYLRIGQANSHPDGTLIIYGLDNPEVFVLDHGFKKSLGHPTDLTGVTWVGTYEVYPTRQ